jgi:hypothetical protein
MENSEVDSLVTEATRGIPDEAKRTAVARRLTAALRTARQPARPEFPKVWRSEPNVMFEDSDPNPAPSTGAHEDGKPKKSTRRR